jgi:hypothetical protein
MQAEVNRSTGEKNPYLSKYRVIFTGILGMLLFIAIFMATGYSWQSQTEKEWQFTEEKVKMIMSHYSCNDPQIRAAIMETFDPLLVAIIIGVESEYRTNSISRAGCRGLMQLSPDKLEDWRDVRQNIRVGASFLQDQIQRFGSMELAIAAYNAGPESVNKYQGIPPYRETIGYLKKTRELSAVYYPEMFSKKNIKLAMAKNSWPHQPEFAELFSPNQKAPLPQ